MLRRKFLKGGVAVGSVALASQLTWNYFFDSHLTNPCSLEPLPERLMQHELMQMALADLDFSQLWDCHFHLIGNGHQPSIDNELSDIWLSDDMQSWSHPFKRLQYAFYLDAACIQNPEFADKEFLLNIQQLVQSIPAHSKFMLLAFDYLHDDDGVVNQQESSFYIPNQYAARIAAMFPAFEWIGSVHPYREDALEQLAWCKQHGARAIKWLPPAMNINPASPKCRAFYEKLIELELPLLSHAGEEKAVHSENLQSLSNPLLLRQPLEMGVKVIIAHCASLGFSDDIEAKSKTRITNFELFTRLMNEQAYTDNLLADISAINLFNREIKDIKTLLNNQHWHSRLLYASDYPLPGVMPIISSTNLYHHQLLAKSSIKFLQEVRQHNVWLFDFVQKRLLENNGKRFDNAVFATRQHFVNDMDQSNLTSNSGI